MKKIRLNILLVIVLIFSGVLGFRLYQLQVTEANYWSGRAERQHQINQEAEGSRGSVFVQNTEGEAIPLAVNRTWQKAYLSPRKIEEKNENKNEIALQLSDILDIDLKSIEEGINRDSSFQVLKRRLTDEEVNAVQDLDYEGVNLREEEVRYYPQGDFASHIIGFVGGLDQGQYGVEGYYNNILSGSRGVREGVRRNPAGSLITEDSARTGASIDLTIDYNIQFMAEKLLSESAEELEAVSGTVIVGDPDTGKILALANYPDFNPNSYNEVQSIETFKNNATQSLFEPGSVFKPIVMAMGLEEGVVEVGDTYYDEGYVEVSGHRLHNYGQREWGEVDMAKIMKESINTGMVHVQQRLNNEVFLDYLKKFGFFERTDIDLQGEVYSENLTFKEGYDVNFANASFGQGIKVTPIQLFNSFLVLANGGELVKPHLAENFNSEPETKREVISSETTSEITSMLINVVEDGTAQRAKIPGYYIAGKTGTAQIPWSSLGENRRGYSGETVQTFIGYGPLNSEFIILVSMDRPNSRTAGSSVVPVFRDLAKYIIDYKQIPPDYVRE